MGRMTLIFGCGFVDAGGGDVESLGVDVGEDAKRSTVFSYRGASGEWAGLKVSLS